MTGQPASRVDRHQAGILDPAAARDRIEVGRVDPPARLAGHVDYLWWVSWPKGEDDHRQEVIPRGIVHLSAELFHGEPRLMVHGVHTRRFDRVLVGEGRVVAAAFHPGGFRPFLRRHVSALRDREVPAGEVLGVDDRAVAGRLTDLSVPMPQALDDLSGWLLSLHPEPDPLVARLAGLVERAESDRTIVRAEQLADLAGVTLRTLQRQFASHVGIGPKWVVQRSRLLDVAFAAHSEKPVDWAALAHELGYVDQSHLIRAFTALVGRPPAAYSASEPRRTPS